MDYVGGGLWGCLREVVSSRPRGRGSKACGDRECLCD